MKKSLNEIGLKYGTDKSEKLHNYLKEYEKLFPDPDNITAIAEIGLKRGGKWKNGYTSPSLSMWGEFFRNANLFGFDIRDLDFSKEPRVKFIKGNQQSISDILAFSEMIGEVDMILDDGSHTPTDQLRSFILLWKNVKSGGIYIIEDCNAEVQKLYPRDARIHKLIKPYLYQYEHEWISSDSAGEKSSLVIKKP